MNTTELYNIRLDTGATRDTALITSVIQALSKSAKGVWSSSVENLPAATFKFVRKALLNQLPTALNLVRWAKSSDSMCPLCIQESLSHVLQV